MVDTQSESSKQERSYRPRSTKHAAASGLTSAPAPASQRTLEPLLPDDPLPLEVSLPLPPGLVPLPELLPLPLMALAIAAVVLGLVLFAKRHEVVAWLKGELGAHGTDPSKVHKDAPPTPLARQLRNEAQTACNLGQWGTY